MDLERFSGMRSWRDPMETRREIVGHSLELAFKVEDELPPALVALFEPLAQNDGAENLQEQ